MNNNFVTKRYMTIKQTATLYPVLTECSLRWLIFNEENNGFMTCVRRLGRKVIIDADALEKWIDQNGGTNNV